ncbi:MAG TPA: ABC transporter permease [Anaerolineales bacterium]|nr:ABC transporter permease [Anaerolineales bacterium]
MKSLDIAIKDIVQSFRSLFAIAFMFVIPILVTGLFALIFGGTGGDDDEAAYQLPIIPVQIVNLDEGQMGGILTDIFQIEALEDLLDVTTADEVAAARQAVDEQAAQVAVIIPADFSAALFDPTSTTDVELYQDPTLSIGPGIVATLVDQFLTSFSGSTILLEVAGEQFDARGVSLSEDQYQLLVAQYTQAVQTLGGESNMLHSETPGGEVQQTNGGVTEALGMIMAGMMIFYAFFTGTYASNTILKEEEEGTLARLFSTATPRQTILAGKLIAASLMIFVQIIVLLLFGWLVFDIHWGRLLWLALFSLTTTLAASTFGLFAISLAKDRKQAGVINGAGVTVTGMLGMAGIFMLSSPNPSQVVNNLSLLVPQGWANQAVIAMFTAQPAGEILPYMAGLLAWSAVFFYVGFRRFQKRFA